MRHARSHCLLWAMAIAGCVMAMGSGAAEQSFYKSVLPNGRVVYGDEPVAGAKRADKITVRTDTSTSDVDAAAAQRALHMTRQQLLRDADARTARLAQLDPEITSAYGELKNAQEAREAGQAMQEGDRQGRRILPQYRERMRNLDAQVLIARQRLDALLADRRALSR